MIGPDWVDRVAVRRPLWEHKAVVLGLAFSPDGQLLAAAGSQRIILWPAAGGPPSRELEHGALVWAVTFSPDGRLLAASDGGAVRLWGAS